MRATSFPRVQEISAIKDQSRAVAQRQQAGEDSGVLAAVSCGHGGAGARTACDGDCVVRKAELRIRKCWLALHAFLSFVMAGREGLNSHSKEAGDATVVSSLKKER